MRQTNTYRERKRARKGRNGPRARQMMSYIQRDRERNKERENVEKIETKKGLTKNNVTANANDNFDKEK